MPLPCALGLVPSAGSSGKGPNRRNQRHGVSLCLTQTLTLTLTLTPTLIRNERNSVSLWLLGIRRLRYHPRELEVTLTLTPYHE